MIITGSLWRTLCCLLVLGALPGAVRADPRSQEPPRDQQQSCQAPFTCCSEHIYIYMINGLTILPHVFGSMNRVAPFVEELGFRRPQVASHYWRWSFQDDIRRIHEADPGARFVLVGYSIGGSVACSMAETLEKDGIFVDLVVYIDAHSFIRNFTKRPGNVGKIVSINSSGLFLPGKCHAGEECHQVDTIFHLAAPRQDATLQILADELTKLAASPHGL